MDSTQEVTRLRDLPVNPQRWKDNNWENFLEDLLAQEVVIETHKAKRAVFITDAGGLAHGLPSGVLRAQNAKQISKLLQAAQKHKIPVTVRGGGLTTEGESIAYGGVLLDMTGMSRIKNVDKENLLARTEAGIFWHSFAEGLRPYGLDYQSAPLNFTSSVGGTIGVGGVDINSPVRGCSADQVEALEVVTPTGEIIECSKTLNKDLFNKVVLGYGQFGVITEATLKVRKYTPIRMSYFFYSDMRTAIEDMQQLVFDKAADYFGILTINDKAINLLVAFDSDEAEAEFKKKHLKKVRGYSEMIFAIRMGIHYLLRPWLLKEALFLFKRKQALFPEFHRPEFMDGNKIHDRTVVYSRAVWKFWGGKVVVIPDIATNTENFADAVIEGVKVCKKHFPYFTLYCV
ncbi:MAG: FAD-binding oxidoreductase [Bdellovibrionota bacterium]